MKVGILGSGDVAKTLGSGFLKHGHDVTMGTRAPAKLADWAKQNPKGQYRRLCRRREVRRTRRTGGQGHCRAGRIACRERGESGRQARHRCDQSHCRCAAQQRRAEVLHQSRRISHGTAPARIRQCALRQGLQLGRQCIHGEPAVQGRQTNHVHLRERRGGEEDRERGSRLSSDGRRRTWAKPRRPARSSRCACFGVSPASSATTGFTPLSC